MNRYALARLDSVCRRTGVSFVRIAEAKGLKERLNEMVGQNMNKLVEKRTIVYHKGCGLHVANHQSDINLESGNDMFDRPTCPKA